MISCTTVEIEQECNTKHRKTSIVLDSDNKSTAKRNVILPLDGLIYFLEDHFCCKKCCRSIKKCADEQPQSSLVLEVFGLVCGINFKCTCGAKGSLSMHICCPRRDGKKSLKDGKPFVTRLSLGNFQIIRFLQSGLQLYGEMVDKTEYPCRGA